jgi:hypothetical protein
MLLMGKVGIVTGGGSVIGGTTTVLGPKRSKCADGRQYVAGNRFVNVAKNRLIEKEAKKRHGILGRHGTLPPLNHAEICLLHVWIIQ